ncbi:putative arabinose-binding protein precursor [bacterium BMS3Bbin03]|nr:putative arabinose-binding protein precursor [bacterium BMS3Bbin03]
MTSLLKKIAAAVRSFVPGGLIPVLMISGVLLNGCGSEHQETGKNGIVHLTYWPSANEYEINLAVLEVAQWNAAHPKIQIKMQPIPSSQSSEEVLLAAIAGKTTPDICSNIWPGKMGQFTRAKAVVQLDTFADFDSLFAARIPENLIKDSRYLDGHFYQIPWKTNPVMIQYNVGMFKSAGVDTFPRTYSQYLKAGRKLTRDLNGDGQIDQWMGIVDVRAKWWVRFFDFYPFYIAASGGQTLLKGRKVLFDTQASVDVFRFFQTGFNEGIFPRARFQTDPFLMKIVASRFTGPWEIAHTEKYKPKGLTYDFAQIPLPDGKKGHSYTYGDPKNIVIFSTTKHAYEAWQFVKFLVTPKADLNLLKLSGQLPVRKGLMEDSLYRPYFRKNPMMVKFAKMIPFTRGVDSVPEMEEIFDAISLEFEASAILGKRTPEDAVKRAAKRCRQILIE